MCSASTKFVTICCVLAQLVISDFSIQNANVKVLQKELLLQMPGLTTTKDDQYMCTSFNLSQVLIENNFDVKVARIKEFSGVQSGKAHHIILYTCGSPIAEVGTTWDCLRSKCDDVPKQIYVWTRNHDNDEIQPLKMPANVSMALHPSSKNQSFLVLQIHYAKVTSIPDWSGVRLKLEDTGTKYYASLLELSTWEKTIPRLTPNAHIDANCPIWLPTGDSRSNDIHVFAYLTHTHKWGYSIRGYKVSLNERSNRAEIKEILKGNPQWPQQFYPMSKEVTLSNGEGFMARCSYNTMKSPNDIKIGTAHTDEMCVLYMMYYTENESNAVYRRCNGETNVNLKNRLPLDSDSVLPPSPP